MVYKIYLYLNSVGISTYDVAFGKIVYDQALEKEIGQDIDF